MQALESLGYFGMLVVSFLSATLLPLGSEAFFTLLYKSDYLLVMLVLTASIGNTAGSIFNYWLGHRYGETICMRWLGIKPVTMNKAKSLNQKWGNWVLLFAWAPVIGDPITAVAGVLRSRFITFVILVGLAKTVRYMALALLIS